MRTKNPRFNRFSPIVCVVSSGFLKILKIKHLEQFNKQGVKGLVHPKMKMILSFTYPYVPNP